MLHKSDHHWIHFVLNALIAIYLVILVVSAYQDWQITSTGWVSDLRTRTVGSRVFLAGIDPYTYHWQLGEPQEWVDLLDQPSFPRSRLTITPTLLTVLLPFAHLNYGTIKTLWFVVEWLLYIGTGLIVMSCTTSRYKQKFILLLFTVVAGSYVWRSHVLTGQVYMLYSFLLAVMYKLLTIKHIKSPVMSGLLLGASVLMRPTLLLVNVPYVLFRKLTIPIASGFGMVIGFLITSIFVHPTYWLSYRQSIEDFSQIQYDIFAYYFLPLVANYSFPIENAIISKSDMVIAVENSALQYYLAENWSIFLTNSLLAIGGLVILAYCGFVWWRARGQLSLEKLFVFGVIATMLIEFFLPAPRYLYYDVQWVLPIALIILHVNLRTFLTSFYHLLVPFIAFYILADQFIGPLFLACYVTAISTLILRKSATDTPGIMPKEQNGSVA